MPWDMTSDDRSNYVSVHSYGLSPGPAPTSVIDLYERRLVVSSGELC